MRGEARNRARIGRKVAALFGIAGGPSDSDAGAGRAWLASYSELTLNELLLGGPQRMKVGHPHVIDTGVFGSAAHGVRATPATDVGTTLNLGQIGNEAISPALVRGYGPDPKAAVTLTGVNEVLRPLTDALIGVLTRLAFPDARLLMGTTAMLLEEAFRSQPLLILAGVQASRIQRAHRLEDMVAVVAEPPGAQATWRSSRVDLPWRRARYVDPASSEALAPKVATLQGVIKGPLAAPEEDRLQPFRLELVDAVWNALTAEAPARSDGHRGVSGHLARLVPVIVGTGRFNQPRDASQISFARDRALAMLTTSTENVLFGLGDGVGGTQVVLQRRAEDGHFAADAAILGARAARVFVDAVLGTYVHSAPVAARATGSPVPPFNPAQWRAAPSLVQRVALWAHHCAERFVVSGAWAEDEPRSRSFPDRIAQRVLLAGTAAELLGIDDPLAAELRVYATYYQLEAARREIGTRGHTRLLRERIDAYSDAVEAMLRLQRLGRLSDSHVVEALQPTLVYLQAAGRAAGPDLARTVSGRLERYWEIGVAALLRLHRPPSRWSFAEVLAGLADPNATADPALCAVLEASSNLAAAVADFDRPDALELAIRIQRNLCTRRKLIFGRENHWSPYRQALVDLAGLLMARAHTAEPEQRPDILREVVAVTAEALRGHEVVGAELQTSLIALRWSEHGSWELDALLNTLAELWLSTDDGELDQETAWLRQQVCDLLGSYPDGIRQRLEHPDWATESRALPRAALLRALEHDHADRRDAHQA